MTKLCMDCRWFRSAGKGHNAINELEYGKCFAPPLQRNRVTHISPVTGLEVVDESGDPYYASTLRKFDHECGKEGKHWDPKPSKIRDITPSDGTKDVVMIEGTVSGYPVKKWWKVL